MSNEEAQVVQIPGDKFVLAFADTKKLKIYDFKSKEFEGLGTFSSSPVELITT